MSGAELAALITAIGVSIGGVITAIAALKNSNANALRMGALEKENEQLKAESVRLRSESDRLREQNELKTLHNERQDETIIKQQSDLNRYQMALDRSGRQINQLQLSIGALQREASEHRHDTLPLDQIQPKN